MLEKGNCLPLHFMFYKCLPSNIIKWDVSKCDKPDYFSLSILNGFQQFNVCILLFFSYCHLSYYRITVVERDPWRSSSLLLEKTPYNRWHSKASRQILSNSSGDSRTFLGCLFQCSVTLTVEKFFLIFVWNFWFSCLHSLLDTIEKTPIYFTLCFRYL